MNTALSLADIDAQITQQKSVVQAANDAITQLQTQRVDVFVQTPVILSNDKPYTWELAYCSKINLYAGHLQGNVEIDCSHLEATVVVAGYEVIEHEVSKIDDMWRQMQASAENVRNSEEYLIRAIYSDLDLEESATCYWVFALKSGGCVLLSYSTDNKNADYFKAMVGRYLHTVSKAYRITVEDNLC